MRINKLIVQNFRVFGKKEPIFEIDLDGDLVVIYGRNGVGKTSIFDAIDWCLFNTIQRFNNEDRYDKKIIRNLFAPNDESFVELYLSENNILHRIKRIYDKKELILLNDKHSNDRSILDLIKNPQRKDLITRKNYLSTIINLFIASNYLGQDTIRKFIDGDEKEKYRSLMKLIGFTNIETILDKIDGILKICKNKENGFEENLLTNNKNLSEFKNKYKVLVQNEKKINYENYNNKKKQKEISSLLNEINITFKYNENKKKSEIENTNNFIYGVENRITNEKDDKNLYLRNLKELQDDLQDYENNIVKINNYKKEKNENDKKLKQVSSEIDSITKDVNKLKKEKTETENDIKIIQNKIDNEHLKTNRNKIENKINSMKEDYDKIKKNYDSILSQKKDEKKIYYELLEKQTKIKEEINNLVNDKTIIDFLYKEIDRYLQLKDEANLLQENILNFNSEITKKQNEIKIITEKEQENNLKKMKLETEYKVLEHDISLRNKLLIQFKDLINSSTCPLCNHDYNNIEDLKYQVEKNISEVPKSIQNIIIEIKKIEENLQLIKIELLNNNNIIKKLDSDTEQVNNSLNSIKLHIINFENYFSKYEAFNNKDISKSLIDDEFNKVKLKQFDNESELNKIEIEINGKKLKIDEFDMKIKIFENDLLENSKEIESLEKEINNITNITLSNDVIFNKEELLNKIEEKKTNLKNINSKIENLDVTINVLKNNRELFSCNNLEIEDKKNILVKTVNLYEIKLDRLRISRENIKIDIKSRIKITNDTINNLQNIQDELENLKKYVNYLSFKKDIDIIDEEIKKLKKENDKLNDNKNRYIEIISYFKNLKRDISKEIKNENETYISKIQPLIQKVFSKLYGHPLFDEIDIEIKTKNDDGIMNLFAKYFSKNNETNKIEPKKYFSEAQLNLFAISFFIGMSLVQDWSLFETLLLDDPIQHFDDLNELAFIDLLRNTLESKKGNQKQIILSTCSLRFYNNIISKLYYMTKRNDRKIIAYRLDGVGKTGPDIIRDI